MNRFIDRVRILDNKLGPLLYQLPPNMHRNDDVLESFLATLPDGLRHVFEFRHESWIDEGVFKLLRRYNAGFCVFDMPSFTCPLIATADFAYIRFHGSTGLYWSYYSNKELVNWAKKISDLAKNLEATYIYFNNDAEAFAVSNAKTLRTHLEAE
jgi:uncharacterized protein YecE (DUF72 family)